MFLRFIIFTCVVLFFSSCKKDKDPSPANTPPSVSIKEGKSKGGYIYIDATYGDSDGSIVAMQFVVLKNGDAYYKNTVFSPFPDSPVTFANVLCTCEAAATYTIYLEAQDNKGAITRSNGVTVTLM